MAKNANFVSHKKSKQIVDGKPKLPLASDLVEGEIAINFGKDVETLSIKNESGDVVTFSSDKYYTEQKLGSGFTGENSAVTVTDVIVENEEIVSSALNDLKTNKTDVSAFTTHTASTVHMNETEKSNLDSLATNIAAISGITSDKIDSWNAAAGVDLTQYYKKTETSGKTELETAFNGKANTADIPSVSGYADSVKYNPTSKYVEFYHGTTAGTKVFEYDASPFLIDGMVQDVKITGVTSGDVTVTCLVISFNTDAGKQDINIPLTEIFDPSNYYTKSETSGKTELSTAFSNKLSVSDFNTYSGTVDTLIGNKASQSDLSTLSGTVTAHTANTDIHVTTEDKATWNAKSDFSGNYNDLTNKPTIPSKTSDLTNDSDFATSGYVDTAVSDMATKTWVESQDYLTSADVSGKQDVSGMTAYTEVTTFTAHTTDLNVHVTTAEKNTWNAKLDTDDISGKTDVSAFTAHTASTVHMNDTEKKNLDSLATNIEAISGITADKIDSWNAAAGTDLTQYYKKTETSGSTELSTAFGNKADIATTIAGYGITDATITNQVITLGSNSITVSSATQVNTALNGKSDTGHTHIASDVTDLGTMAKENKTSYSSATEVNTALSGKADVSDIPSVTGYADSVKYNSTTKYVEFYHGTTAGTKVFEYDASPFLIDGMVQNVEIKDVTSGASQVTCLVISFNTDAGKQDINIPLTDIFNANNYYTKTDIDNLVGSGFTSSSITEVIIENERIASAALNDLELNKLDASAYTPTDLSNYYTKDETSGASQISTALNGKTDTATTTALNNVVTAHTADSTSHLTSTEKSQLHAHTNKTYLDGITGTVGTMVYENASSYSSATQVSTALSSKSNTGHTHDERYFIKSEVEDKIDAISGSSTGATSKTITAITQNGGVVTPTYANISITKSQVSDFPSSMTPSAHTHKSNEINGMDGYSKASSVSAIATGDTLNQAIGKLEKALDGKQASGDYVANATYTAYTAATNTAIGNKAAKASAFTSAEYNSTDKKIYFKNEAGTNVANIDATDFIKDGMIDSVELVSKSGTTYLVITWNTDAGKEMTELNIGDAFEADNYYTKADLTSTTTTVKVKNASVADSANAVALSNVSGADDLKAIEALTSTSGILKKTAANTWALDTTSYSSATQVSTALGNKVDKVSGKGLSTNDFTNTEKTNLDSLATNIATISGITSTKVSNWDTAYTNNHTHSNKSYLDGINDTIGTAAYKAEGYFAGSGHTHAAYVNQNAFSNVKVGTTTVAADSATDTIELVGSGIITITPDATNDKITISASNAVTSVANKTGAVTLVKGDVGLGNVDNTADANKKVASAATAAVAESVALSNVSGADDLKAIEALAGTSGILKKTAANTWSLDTTSYSSATEVNTALGGKSNTGHTHDDRYFTETEITNKIAAMSASTSGSAAKTITALSESNGVISATYADISITKSQVSDFAHNQASNTITAMTSYAKASAASAIAASDTLNTAIGKLEKALDGKQASGSYVTTSRNISTASGLTGGGNLSANRTLGLEAVTVGNYNGSSVTTNMVSYDTYGRVSSAAPVIYSAVTISANTSNVTCPTYITGASKSGAQAIVLYVNNGSTTNYTVTVSTSYKSPDGNQISLTCPKNGYAEVNYINIGGVIYARGL